VGLRAGFEAYWSQEDDDYNIHNHDYGKYNGVSGEFCSCFFGCVWDHDLAFNGIQFCFEKFFPTCLSGLSIFLLKLGPYIKLAYLQEARIKFPMGCS